MKVALLLLCIISACSQPVIAQSKVLLLDSLFDALYHDNRFNGNILIAEKGKVIYQKSLGNGNELTGEKLDANSIFELASVAKQFTTMAIVMLKERGALSYDDYLVKYIPALKHYKEVTIRQLMYHNSGIPDYIQLLDTIWDKSRVLTNDSLITIFAEREIPLSFPPDTQTDYSNTGYALLASVIEKVSGQTYGSFLKENIFQPLGMTRTFVATRRLSPVDVSNYAYGYVYSDSLGRNMLPDSVSQFQRVYYYDGLVGQASISSTAPDLFKWDRALYRNQLISPESTEAIFTSGKLNNGKSIDYGFGWMLKKDPVYGRIAAHTGGWPGYVTLIERHLDSDKTIIILENHFTDAVLPFKEVRKILYHQPLPPPRKQISLSPHVLERYTGDYQLGPGNMHIFLKNGKLRMQISGQRSFAIYPESRLKFFLKELDVELMFTEEKDCITALTIYQNGNQTKALKIGL